MDHILKDYGWCQVINRQGQFVIRYDRGSISVEMFEREINTEQAQRALKSQIEAEKVIKELEQNNFNQD